jgi:uncharacterized protein
MRLHWLSSIDAVMNAARARYRSLRGWAHAWLLRRPRLRRTLHAAGSLEGGPEAIARGVAIGLFIGLTPTVGLQTALLIASCVLLSANFPAAFTISFVSNPFTIAPLYWGYHELGEAMFLILPFFTPKPDAGFLRGVGDEIVFTGLGSLLIAIPLSVGAYLLMRLALVTFALRRDRRRQARRAD